MNKRFFFSKKILKFIEIGNTFAYSKPIAATQRRYIGSLTTWMVPSYLKAGGQHQVVLDERISPASVSRPVDGFAWGISQSVAVMIGKAERLAA